MNCNCGKETVQKLQIGDGDRLPGSSDWEQVRIVKEQEATCPQAQAQHGPGNGVQQPPSGVNGRGSACALGGNLGGDFTAQAK